MTTPVRLLIVEDDMIIAANISLQLASLGYEVTGIVPRGEEAIWHVQDNPPDIVLLDINLKGALNGIETASQMQQISAISIIYLTANQISLVASGLPTGLSLSGKQISGTVSSTVGSPYSVSLMATDGGGLSTSTSFTIMVVPASMAPPPTAAFSITV